MERDFNSKHEVIIESQVTALASNPKDGESCPHKKVVHNVKFYKYSDGATYIEVWMSRDKIMDLAKQIQEIEAVEFYKNYDAELPF